MFLEVHFASVHSLCPTWHKMANSHFGANTVVSVALFALLSSFLFSFHFILLVKSLGFKIGSQKSAVAKLQIGSRKSAVVRA